jgi:hypothetical protein
MLQKKKNRSIIVITITIVYCHHLSHSYYYFKPPFALLISTFEMQPNSVRIYLRLSFYFSPPVSLQFHLDTSQ